ncbi:MAG TPA: hypothetical protein ENJ18_12780 [Nannocystis exedens]|nr:hypothetical protein [Nannocystis exedens]
MAPPSDHWLLRLSADDWLRAATTELRDGRAATASRRAALSHARRAAGMALNGVLVANFTNCRDLEATCTRWGRSYIDHLRALATDVDLEAIQMPRSAAIDARELLRIPLQNSQNLVQLSASPHQAALRALGLARSLVDAASSAIDQLRRATRSDDRSGLA